MKIELTVNDTHILITTEHSASSYGEPVVLIDGELTDIQAIVHQDVD